MRRTNSSPERWNLAPIPPESKTQYEFSMVARRNYSYLVLLVLGLLLTGH